MSKDDALCLILVGETNIQERENPVDAFRYVLPMLKSADVLFGHLEAPLTQPSQDPALPDIPHKDGWRHSSSDMVEAFSAAGFAAVSLASNVMYGRQAIWDTIETLDRAGIQHCGAGRNLEEARKPAIVLSRGVRFGFLSYTSVFWPVGHAAGANTPGVATVRAYTAYQPSRRTLEMPGAPPIVITWADPTELQTMEMDIRALRDLVDIVVVSMHWGISSSNQMIDYQREVGQAAIRAGADLVMGHHPHCPQGIEIVEGRPIFYSLGNFAFDWYKMRGRNLEGMLLKCTIRQRILERVAFVPVRRNQENLVEILDPSQEPGNTIVDQVRELSAAYGTTLTTADNEVVVNLR